MYGYNRWFRKIKLLVLLLKNDELCKYNTGELLGEDAFSAVYKLPKIRY